MQVLTDPRYKKAAYVGATLMFFSQFTGINAIMQYSGQIFSSAGSLSTFQATAVCNIVNFLAPIACLITLNYVGKRPVMLVAQTIVVIGMAGAFYFTVFNSNQNLLLALCLIFIVGFEFGPGSLGWPYLGEICHPTAIGFALIVNWLFTLIVGLFYPFLNGEWMPEGWVDLIFVCCSAVGLVFFIVYFKETRGKTPE